MPPVKPEICIIDGKLNVFMGADYKAMSIDVADKFVRKAQGELAKLRRMEKRRLRQLKPHIGESACTSAS